MRVCSDRRLGFETDRSTVWSAITDIERYQEWWPWLRSFDADAFEAGSRWRCRVKPPMPYTLRFEIVLTEVVPEERARATIEGDISGRAELTAHDRGTACELRLVSDLHASHVALRIFGWLARPVAVRGHDWVLDTGAQQFRRVALDPGRSRS